MTLNAKKFFSNSKITDKFKGTWCRWLNFSGCCGPCLEQSSTARHILAVTASLPKSP